jgi:hypothetical protein
MFPLKNFIRYTIIVKNNHETAMVFLFMLSIWPDRDRKDYRLSYSIIRFMIEIYQIGK